jgi:hypothetical protein
MLQNSSAKELEAHDPQSLATCPCVARPEAVLYHGCVETAGNPVVRRQLDWRERLWQPKAAAAESTVDGGT